MNVIKLLPPILSFLLLGAHFMRSGDLVFPIACLVCIPLLFIRKRVLIRLLQVGLAAGTIVWFITTLQIVSLRSVNGEPWHRAALILGIVAVFTGFSAWLLQFRLGEEK